MYFTIKFTFSSLFAEVFFFVHFLFGQATDLRMPQNSGGCVCVFCTVNNAEECFMGFHWIQFIFTTRTQKMQMWRVWICFLFFAFCLKFHTFQKSFSRRLLLYVGQKKTVGFGDIIAHRKGNKWFASSDLWFSSSNSYVYIHCAIWSCLCWQK